MKRQPQKTQWISRACARDRDIRKIGRIHFVLYTLLELFSFLSKRHLRPRLGNELGRAYCIGFQLLQGIRYSSKPVGNNLHPVGLCEVPYTISDSPSNGLLIHAHLNIPTFQQFRKVLIKADSYRILPGIV